MKFSFETVVGIDDVSMAGEALPSALLRIFQNAAIAHTLSVGFAAGWFSEHKRAWVLREVEYVKHAPVRLDDRLHVLTWSRGIEKIRGYRDFTLTRDGTRVVSASSTWIFLDSGTMRPIRVPEETIGVYEPEDERAIPAPLAEDAAGMDFTDEKSMRISIGYRDFDINGHVNNTAYAGYLQTAVYREFGLLPEFRSLRITFRKEIRSGIAYADVKLRKSGATFAFEIAAGDAVCADGVIVLGPDGPAA